MIMIFHALAAGFLVRVVACFDEELPPSKVPVKQEIYLPVIKMSTEYSVYVFSLVKFCTLCIKSTKISFYKECPLC